MGVRQPQTPMQSPHASAVTMSQPTPQPFRVHSLHHHTQAMPFTMSQADARGWQQSPPDGVGSLSHLAQHPRQMAAASPFQTPRSQLMLIESGADDTESWPQDETPSDSDDQQHMPSGRSPQAAAQRSPNQALEEAVRAALALQVIKLMRANALCAKREVESTQTEIPELKAKLLKLRAAIAKISVELLEVRLPLSLTIPPSALNSFEQGCLAELWRRQLLSSDLSGQPLNSDQVEIMLQLPVNRSGPVEQLAACVKEVNLGVQLLNEQLAYNARVKPTGAEEIDQREWESMFESVAILTLENEEKQLDMEMKAAYDATQARVQARKSCGGDELASLTTRTFSLRRDITILRQKLKLSQTERDRLTREFEVIKLKPREEVPSAVPMNVDEPAAAPMSMMDDSPPPLMGAPSVSMSVPEPIAPMSVPVPEMQPTAAITGLKRPVAPQRNAWPPSPSLKRIKIEPDLPLPSSQPEMTSAPHKPSYNHRAEKLTSSQEHHEHRSKDKQKKSSKSHRSHRPRRSSSSPPSNGEKHTRVKQEVPREEEEDEMDYIKNVIKGTVRAATSNPKLNPKLVRRV